MTKSLLYKSAFILSLSSLFSRVLGVVRDHLLARNFGVGGEGIFNLDVYYAAFRVPDFIYALLIMGTVSAAFVPILSGIMHGEGEMLTEKASKFVSNVLGVMFSSVGLACVGMFIFAPLILKLLVPGFESADFELTVMVTRLMLLSPLFFSLSSVLQATQNAFDKFAYYALAPVLYNVGIILGIVFFAPVYGVFGVAIGVILGASLHFLIQIPGVRGLRFRYRPFICLRDKDLREMIRLVIPRIVGMSVMQVNLIFDTIVGSLLAAGSITVLNYAINLNSAPMGMIGVSFAIASFATLSSLGVDVEKASGESKVKALEKFAAQLQRVVTSVLLFVVPAAVLLFILRFRVVDLILNFGVFTSEDVILTANTLAFFLIGLVGQSLIPVFARSFYAFKNTIIPVAISVIAMCLNIALNFYFALHVGMGVYGIALATAIAALFNMLLLSIFLKAKFLKGVSFLSWKRVFGIVFSSLVMGGIVYFVNDSLLTFADISLLNKILALSASILVGMISYGALAFLCGVEEVRLILQKCLRR